jgi:hypothetical protein
MIRRYSGTGSVIGGTDKTMLRVGGNTGGKPTVYDIIVGSPSSPVDQAASINVYRTSTAGTGTAVTPLELSTSGLTASTPCAKTFTVEPAELSPYLKFGMNAQVTFRWQTLPEEGITLNSTGAADGIAIKTDSVSGGSQEYVATFLFTE